MRVGGVHAHLLSLHLSSRTKLWCTLQQRGQIHFPYFYSTPIWTICGFLQLHFNKLYHITSVSEDHKKSFQNVQYILLKQFPQKINIAIKNAEYDSDFESVEIAAVNFASIKDTVIFTFSKNFTSIFLCCNVRTLCNRLVSVMYMIKSKNYFKQVRAYSICLILVLR